jgi:hypothetical protein
MPKINESLHNPCRENDLYHIDQNAATTRASAVTDGRKIAPDYVLTRDSLKNLKIGARGPENDRSGQNPRRKNGFLMVLGGCPSLYS